MLDEDEYLLQMTIKNNKLYSMIRNECENATEFCNKYNLPKHVIYDLLNFKCEIYGKNGTVRPAITNILNTLKCTLSDIIPENYEVKETNKYEKAISEAELLSLSDNTNQDLLLEYTPEDTYAQTELRDQLNKLLDTISPREAKAIKMHYLEGKTFNEISMHFNVTRARVEQLIKTGLRKLMHPSRLRKLVTYNEGFKRTDVTDPQRFKLFHDRVGVSIIPMNFMNLDKVEIPNLVFTKEAYQDFIHRGVDKTESGDVIMLKVLSIKDIDIYLRLWNNTEKQYLYKYRLDMCFILPGKKHQHVININTGNIFHLQYWSNDSWALFHTDFSNNGDILRYYKNVRTALIYLYYNWDKYYHPNYYR